MVESSLVLWGDRVISTSVGKPATVEFDFDAVWHHKRTCHPHIYKQRELTWLHVHPVGYGCQFSSLDQNCAEGLQLAFGNIGWFGILCFRDADPDDIEGEVAWYRLVESKLVLQDRDLMRRNRTGSPPPNPHDIRTWFNEKNTLDHIPWMLKALSTSR